jgi:hypothetical protein
MKRLYSDMTSADFVAWCERHGVTHRNAPDALGISAKQMYRYWQGHRIPRSIALLCQALDDAAVRGHDFGA